MKAMKIAGTRRWGIYRLRGNVSATVWVRVDHWNFQTKREALAFIERYYA